MLFKVKSFSLNCFFGVDSVCFGERVIGPFHSVQREGAELIPSDMGLPLLRVCKKTSLTGVSGTLSAYAVAMYARVKDA